MPPVVKQEKCIACGACENICPGNLMVLEDSNSRAYCRSARDCWDCMACVKACPVQALEVRIPYQLGYYPAKLIPEVSRTEIVWTCSDIYGKEETFKVKVRNK